MAKAVFHKNQRVYVKTVGTWSSIERVVPHWAKGLDEPLRIFYDVGLGREFSAEELQTESARNTSSAEIGSETWRMIRAKNKYKSPEECGNHPYPGTHPQVVTGEAEWGGWRVPGAEYDLYPEKIEHQARLIVSAPRMVSLLQVMIDFVKLEPENVPHEVQTLAKEAAAILRYVEQDVPQ